MKHIFVSHAGADKAIATKLASDLRDAGHETKVDTKELTLGTDSIDFMNQAIADAHTVIILFSQHTANARWQQLEINASLWNEVAQDGGMCIVVRLDETQLPKVYGKLDSTSGDSYRKLLEDLCTAILPVKAAASIVADAFANASTNPFRRVRAEFFEDSPELLARTFAPPDASKVGALEDTKPSLLEGPRGTGKSMLLLSLRGRNYLSRVGKQLRPLPIFGTYLKLTRGALCNAGLPSSASTDPLFGSNSEDIPVIDICAQELFISIIESLVSELEYCIRRTLLTCDGPQERRLVGALASVVHLDNAATVGSLEALRDELGRAHQRVADFVRRRFIYGETPSVPFTHFDIDCLKAVIRATRQELPDIARSMFAILLDEYENLFPFQQRVINGVIKLAAPELTVKVAKKLGTADTSSTTTGQELQEIHDYTRVLLVYDVEDSRQLAAYRQLLTAIVAKNMTAEGLMEVDLAALLPTTPEAEIAEEDRIAEVAQLCKMTVDEFRGMTLAKQQEKLVYYGEAAIYRRLYGRGGRHRDKRFCGADDLVFLSSGVIRYFQEFLGVAFHLAFPLGIAAGEHLALPPAEQSRAVHIVSQHNLAALSRNVEADGETLKYLLLDLGDCLRHKLLKHTSEPEAARLTLEDPERLRAEEMHKPRRILTVGIREGVFQAKDGMPAFRPKHASDPQPVEFNICRLLCPVLQVSPRLRWRTPISCEELRQLLEPDSRGSALAALKRRLVSSSAAEAKKTPLFKDDAT
jgi:hypothetical protein